MMLSMQRETQRTGWDFMVWINTHSNKSNPHGGWTWRPDTIPSGPKKQLKPTLKLSVLNQQWLKNHMRYCACCKKSRKDDKTIYHYYCSACSEHAICCSCNERFIPHANSFLRYCSGCWKLERSLIKKNYELEKIKQNGFHSDSNCNFDHEFA